MEIMAGDSADMAWKMGRILLKYRPIAPKPVTAGSNSNTPVSGAKRKGSGNENAGGRRGRGRGRKRSASKRVIENKSNITCYNSPVVTLPLMPMTPERKEEPTTSPADPNGHVPVLPASWPAWMGNASHPVEPRPARPVGSCVTVECVTDKWRCGEPPAGLETDTCPVFVSDDCDRVTWTNSAYRSMVVGPGEGEGEMMRVALMTRGLVPARELGVTCFMCSVRVRYTCGGRGKVSMAAPCDVWRLTDGRLAWRLDLKAALSLGLGC